jgi:tRNA pseudouridine32 synthase/23S rRNA pseudouridine746 synthase
LKKFECHIDINSDSDTAIAVLIQQCELSIGELKQAINKGALWHSRSKSTQRFRRVKKPLKQGDKLHFYYDEMVLAQVPEPALLIEDLQDYSVWFKPYGMLSQGSKWSDHCTIARWAQQHLTPERPVFIVHRLDRAATGLIIVAHSKKAARALTNMFEHHQLEKQYQIIVHGDHRARIQPEHITTEIDDKSASSWFTHLLHEQHLDMSLVQVKIDSGRKHQIRKHAQSIGFPVVGDRLYGKNKNNNEDDKVNTAVDLQLCAVHLSFKCPLTGEPKKFTLPDELKPSLQNIFDKS